MLKMKKQESNEIVKKSFLQRRLEKVVSPVVNNLLYACFYHLKNNYDTDLTFDDYCKLIRNYLKESGAFNV